MDTSNPTPKTYTSTTGQGYSYQPSGANTQYTQSKQYTPGSYTSPYSKDNSQPTSDSKSGNVLYKSQEGQISSTYTPKPYVPTRDTQSYTGPGTVGGSYRQQGPSADTTVTGDNQSNMGGSGSYNPGANQYSYKPPTGDVNVSVGVKTTYTPGGYQSRVNQPSNTNTANEQSTIPQRYAHSVATRLPSDQPQIRSEGPRTYTGTNQYNPAINRDQPTLSYQGGYGTNVNQPREEQKKEEGRGTLSVSQTIEVRPEEGQNQQGGQDQPVFNNTVFQTEYQGNNQFPGITVTGPHQERQRQFGGELAKSVVDVKYELPEWYQKDKDTELYENMYMIDAVRYTNSRLLHHSPARGTLDGKSSQVLNRTQPSPNPNRHLEEHPNFSRKIETPRSAKKWDKHIPRVILFVSKYNAGDMEEDADDDRPTTPRKDYVPPKHSSPYHLDAHQKAFHEKPQQSQFGAKNRLSAPGVKDGYFDVEEYRTSVGQAAKEIKTDLDDFEEDEGVRQTVRVAEVRRIRR